MDNIPGELLAETLSAAGPDAADTVLRAVAAHHTTRADKLRSLRTRGWKSASDELDTVARHLIEYADQMADHFTSYGSAAGTAVIKSDPTALPGNTGRCASFRRATPDDPMVCYLDRGHDGDHEGIHEGLGLIWPRTHSGHVCGDVVTTIDGAYNCQLPLGHDGDEHHDGAYRLWPRGVGTSRQVTVCQACNHDTHRCPGCGEPIGHFAACCEACKANDAEPDRPIRVLDNVTLHSVSLVADPLPGQEIISVTPVADDYDGQCPGADGDDRCMLPAKHTGRHTGRKGNWTHDYGASTLGEQVDAMRAAMTPAIPAPREPINFFAGTDPRGEAGAPAVLSGIPVDPSDPIHGSATFGPLDTPAAVLVAETREEVTAAVNELTGDEPIGTTVNVGGIEFVKHSDNPFGAGALGEFTMGRQTEHGPMEPPSMNGVPLSNPFAATLNGGTAPLSLDNPFRVAPPPAPKALLLPPHLVPGAPKGHQSVSSIQMMSECALRYRLHYRDGIRDSSPAWWNVGGTAFHSTVQHIEQMHAESGGSSFPIDEPVFQTERAAAEVWHERFDAQIALTESDTDTTPATWRAAKGGKESRVWWTTAGEDMVRRYVQHRREFLRDWRLLTTPTGGLAQEVEFNANIDGVMMKGFIDSAWISADGATIRVEDYKAGSSDGDPFQLKTYGAALRAMGADGEGTRRLVGAFYEARKGAPTPIMELTTADDVEVSYRANTAQQMDRAGIFPANPSARNCSTCSVSHACPVMAMKG